MKSPGKRILLGVTGSVAAYKAAALLRLLVRAELDVRVVQTPSSRRFVGELTFQALSGHPVLCDQFASGSESGLAHIDLAGSDLIVIAPATANTIARMAAGIADNLLLSTYLAARCPTLICPAMNTVMWNHPAVQDNINILLRRGVQVVYPEEGSLACGAEGDGRLADAAQIYSLIRRIIDKEDVSGKPVAAKPRNISGKTPTLQQQDFSGRRILVTAGATREPIDAVRFISNRSSGRMGFSLAAAAQNRGAQVTVIAANCCLARDSRVRYVDVSTNDELTNALQSEINNHDILLMAAAVADYQVLPAQTVGKLERKEINDLQLMPTSDIVQNLTSGGNGCLKVGFAAEYGSDKLERAREKLKKKNLDIMVFNDISRSDIGFESNENEVVVMATGHDDIFIEKTSKMDCAYRILDQVINYQTMILTGGGSLG